jgi:3-phenylpropionate/cinnamic acid dioxygenase small subunit
MSLVKIDGNNGLVRDIHSKAILNTDRVGLEKYMAEREIALRQLQEKNDLKDKVDKLETDMSEIKSLLQALVQMRTPNGN